MLQPARRKYRKEQKGRNKGVATRGAKVSFGEFGLKAIARGRLTARQIEAARRATPPHGAPERGRRAGPGRPTQAGAAASGSASSPKSRSPRSRPKSAWATARA